jgi:hypothetical protein
MLTSAAGLPADAHPDRVLHIVNGTVREAP